MRRGEKILTTAVLLVACLLVGEFAVAGSGKIDAIARDVVSELFGAPVSEAAPANAEVLTYNSTTGVWEAAAAAGGSPYDQTPNDGDQIVIDPGANGGIIVEGDTNNQFYAPADDEFGVIHAGTEVMRSEAGKLQLKSDQAVTWQSGAIDAGDQVGWWNNSAILTAQGATQGSTWATVGVGHLVAYASGGGGAIDYWMRGSNPPMLGMASDSVISWATTAAANGDHDDGIWRNATGKIAIGNPSHEYAASNPQHATLVCVATDTQTLSGATTDFSAGLIPANVIVLGVTSRVTTAITSGAGTDWDLGDGTTVNEYGDALAFTQGTTSDLSGRVDAGAALFLTTSSITPRATCNGGTFSGGVVRVTVHYLDLLPPQANN